MGELNPEINNQSFIKPNKIDNQEGQKTIEEEGAAPEHGLEDKDVIEPESKEDIFFAKEDIDNECKKGLSAYDRYGNEEIKIDEEQLQTFTNEFFTKEEDRHLFNQALEQTGQVIAGVSNDGERKSYQT